MTAAYQMAEVTQASTLGIVIIVAAIMIAGIVAIARDIRATWSIDDANADIDDMARDYFIGRDLHTDVRDLMREARR